MPLVLALLLPVVLLVGCTYNVKMRVAPTARLGAAGDKIPLHVGLLLDDRFCTFTDKFQSQGDTIVTSYGPVLRAQAISLCEQTFQKVTVFTNGVTPSGVDAVLQPDVQRLAYAGLEFTLLVQWTLRDTDNHHILWMNTADAQAAAPPKKVYQQLFDDLNSKTYRSIQNSPEIKRLITQRR